MKASEQVVARRLGVVREREAEERAKRTAAQTGIDYLDLRIYPVDRGALPTLTAEEARETKTVVIRRLGKSITVALTDPNASATEKLLEKLRKEGYHIRTYLVSPVGLARAIGLYKELPPEIEKVITGSVTLDETRVARFSEELLTFTDIKQRIPEALAQDTSSLLELFLAGGLRLGASDIHFEMSPETALVRMRLDGLLYEAGTLGRETANALVRRIKLLSNMKLNITSKPQDGRFSLNYAAQSVELRVSVIPGEYGEEIVMRILNPATIALSVADLGIRSDLYERILKTLKQPNGMIITTGPTGSGKTTALYAFLRTLASSEVKVITIEDPIEYHLEGVAQTQIESAHGYTFAAALRSVLRQDPDVILVGEIRDRETAETALAAALTGHLVLSTLHTNDASGSIPRLLDLGVKAASIAPALSLALAQRLVRRLCAACKKAHEASEGEYKTLAKALDGVPPHVVGDKLKKPLTLFHPVGCPQCLGGYKGRVGVFEALFANEKLEQLILESPPASRITQNAIENGMVTLRQDALLKVLEGVTSIEEIDRSVGTAN